jgi:hypothetical protein
MKRQLFLPFVYVGAAEASINPVYTVASFRPRLHGLNSSDLLLQIQIRGGGSESAPAWNAGSRLSQRLAPSSPGKVTEHLLRTTDKK